VAADAQRAVAPRLPAAGGKYPIAAGRAQAQAARQWQAMRQPSGRQLQARTAPACMHDIHEQSSAWLDLELIREMQGVEADGIGMPIRLRVRLEVFAVVHGDDVSRANGPAAAPIRPASRVPIHRS